MNDTVAKAIFQKCKELGIEEIALFELWEDTSEATRDIYREIAKAALSATDE